jgi:hypothetical protein
MTNVSKKATLPSGSKGSFHGGLVATFMGAAAGIACLTLGKNPAGMALATATVSLMASAAVSFAASRYLYLKDSKVPELMNSSRDYAGSVGVSLALAGLSLGVASVFVTDEIPASALKHVTQGQVVTKPALMGPRI